MATQIQYIWNDLMHFLQSNLKNTAYYNIAYEILIHIDEVHKMKIEELANFANVTPSTITKFCQSIGINGFNELKTQLSEYNETKSNIINIKERYNESQYLDAFLVYDSRLTMKLFENLDKNKNLRLLLKQINPKNKILLLTPDYANSPVVSFSRMCTDEKIHCIAISRKAEECMIIDLINQTDVVMIISSSGTWMKTESELIKKINEMNKNIYIIGSEITEEITAKYHSFTPIRIADKEHLLDFHYSSSRIYSLFFIYLALNMNIKT